MQAVARPLLGAVAAFRYLLVFTVAKHTIAPRNSTDAVAIKVVCALSNGDIADDLECPLTTSFSAFCTIVHSFATGDFRFCTAMQSLSLVMSKGHVSNFYIVDLEISPGPND